MRVGKPLHYRASYGQKRGGLILQGWRKRGRFQAAFLEWLDLAQAKGRDMDLAGTATTAFRAWGLVALFSTSFYGYLGGGGLGDIVVGLVVRAATPGAGGSGRARRNMWRATAQPGHGMRQRGYKSTIEA